MGCFFRQPSPRTLWLTGSLYLCLLTCTSPGSSQIIPDNTLPNNTVVLPNGNTSLIERGTRVGGNLFHSFQDFSIPTGSEAFFNNELDIQNILSRVTGGNISNIDGTLRANGTANLFFINPNGITFGSNAQLNIGGSFIGSTANSIRFSDGSEFSATNPQAPPLLTINAPIGLQFGSSPGKIINQSQVTSSQLFPFLDPRIPTGLQVPPGQTLALVGGDVSMNGGNLTAVQGRIELGSVASSGLVSLTPTAIGLVLGYDGIQNFGNIALSGAAVNASGLGGGAIQVRGGQVTLTQGSRLVADTFGNSNGGGIDIQANQFRLQEGAFVSTSTFGLGAAGNLTVRADAIELTGTTPFVTAQQLLTGTFNPFSLSDGLYSLSVGSGKAGDITVDTNQLRVQNGANLMNPALLHGNGGNLTLRVSDLAEFSHGTLVFTGTAGGGNAGNIDITAKELRLLDGSSLSTTPGPASTGTGGNITVTADAVEMRGTPAGVAVPGGLFTTALGTGDAGYISVTTNQLVVADGTQISTSTAGAGRGGDLSVTADTVELSGISADGRFIGGLLASASLVTVPGMRGNASAGNLTVTTRRLSVQNGAQISAATGSAGTAGTLNVNASESVDVSGFATGVDPSVEAVSFGIVGDGIVPSAIETNTRGAGKAGDLTIQTGRLTVRDGAEVGVRSTDTGLPGDLKVRADSILLDNQGRLSATSILGQGGDIDLQVKQDLVLRNGSQISTQAGTEDTGGGNGGNITINTGVLAVFEKSRINAKAFQGAGGNIRITTQGIFVSPDSSITASSTLGVNGVVEINQLGANPSQGLVELPVEVVDATGLATTGCSADKGSSFVVTGRGGLPEDPTQTLRGQTVWRDLRLGQGSAATTPTVNSPSSISNSQHQIIEATGWVMNTKSQVELVSHAPQANPQTPWYKSADCQRLNVQQVKQ